MHVSWCGRLESNGGSFWERHFESGAMRAAELRMRSRTRAGIWSDGITGQNPRRPRARLAHNEVAPIDPGCLHHRSLPASRIAWPRRVDRLVSYAGSRS